MCCASARAPSVPKLEFVRSNSWRAWEPLRPLSNVSADSSSPKRCPINTTSRRLGCAAFNAAASGRAPATFTVGFS
eukprot:scaffold125881_cov27-Tisochrysis_lutea.AAC.1